MLVKFELENLESNEKKKYKSLREVSADLNIEYHQARALYLQSVKPKKFLHGISKKLNEKYKLYDNPDLEI